GVVDTGVPPSIAAQWMVQGRTKGPGVVPPEIAFEPVAYFTELSAQGRGIRVTEIAEEMRTLNGDDPPRHYTLGWGASPYRAVCSLAAWSWTAGALSRCRCASFAIAANAPSATSRAHSTSSSVCSVERNARSPVFGIPNKTLFPRQWMNQFHQRRVFALRVSRKFRISSFVVKYTLPIDPTCSTQAGIRRSSARSCRSLNNCRP